MEIRIWVVFIWLLRTTWLAWILLCIGVSLPLSSLDTLRPMIVRFSRRGKTLLASTRFIVPQSLFLHFYITGVVWTSLLVGATWIYAHGMEALVLEPFPYTTIKASDLTKAPSSPFLRRRYEVWKFVSPTLNVNTGFKVPSCKYVGVQFSPSAWMHIMGYFIGVFYYRGEPLSLFCNILPEAFTYWENMFSEMIGSGKSQMQPVEFKLWEYVIPLTMLGWHQWISTIIFIWGWFHQHECHKILVSLCKNGTRSDQYMTPHGDWFEIVSCPVHYLAKIVMYVGLFVASGASHVTVFLLLIFVVANLTFAASETHR